MRKSNKIIYRFEGDSMFPLLHSNDIIVCKDTTFQEVKVDDLIMVKKKGRTLIHRLIYKTDSYLITKGDNNLYADSPTYSTEIRGKLVQVERNSTVFYPENTYIFQSALYFQEIAKVTDIFENKNILFVILKGLPVHLYYEQTHPRRIYADCDILIDKNDINTVTKILYSRGYRKANIAFSDSLEKLKNKTTEMSFVKSDDNATIVLDVHLEINMGIVHIGRLDALYPQEKIDYLSSKLRNERKIIVIQGKRFPILSVENMIVYLSIHLFQHGFKGSFRYDFLDRIIDSLPNNKIWNKCRDIIRINNLQNYIFPVLLLLTKKYRSKIPDDFMTKIRPTSKLVLLLVKKISHIDMFSDEPRFVAGINRFKNLFLFSPNPWWKKIWVLCNIRVIYTICWVVWKRIMN